jgi:hypothetical protein
LNLEKAKEELQQFNDGHREYEMDLQFQKQCRGEEITEEMREIAEAELDDIVLNQIIVQDAVDLEIVVQDAVDLAKVEVKKKRKICLC